MASITKRSSGEKRKRSKGKDGGRNPIEGKPVQLPLGLADTYWALFYDSPYPAWVFDADTLRFLAVNRQAIRHYGYSKEEFQAMTVKDIRPQTDVPDFLKSLSNFSSEGTFTSVGRWRHLKKNGSIIDVEIAAQTLRFGRRNACLVIVADVTDRLRAEKQLRESEERFRIAFQNAPIPSALADLGGRFQMVNPAFSSMMGYSEQELLSMNYLQLTHPEDRESSQSVMAKVLNGEHPRATFKKRYVAKTGHVLWGRVNLTCIRDSEGNVLQTLGQVVDITEQLALESELRQAQKLEALGGLAGGVAHDFNNLLVGIICYSELLAEELQPGSPSHTKVTRILSAAERATSVTSKLLAFSRKQLLALTPLDLNQLIIGLTDLLKKLVEEDIEIQSRLDPSLPLILADAGQMQNVIFNLVSNARDAMPGGGLLIVDTTNVRLEEATLTRPVGIPPGHYALLAVRDNGVGMDEATLAHIFEPFFTTKEAGKGTGLGLPTAYGIIRQSGGYISVHSEVGVGSELKVYMPALVANADLVEKREPAYSPERMAQPRGKSGTILLAEDDGFVRETLKDCLLHAGYTVVEAKNGHEVLEIFERSGAAIDLLLTDVVMPGLRGTEIGISLRARAPTLRILYMSGHVGTSRQLNALQDGEAFLAKPFTADTLLEKIRRLLRKGESST